MNYFWTNTIWYLILGTISIAELIYLLVKSKQKKLVLGLFITLVGATVFFEIIIMTLYKSYSYFPRIYPEAWQHYMIPHSSFYWYNESSIGNFFSQFSVSVTAVLLADRHLKYYWYIICIFIYGLIEEFFLYLGIYEHNWYRTWMTIAGLLVLFCLALLMYKKSLKGNGRFLLFIYIFNGFWFLNAFMGPMWIMYLFGIQTFTPYLLPDPPASASAVYCIFLFIQGITVIIAYFLKPGWWWHTIVTGVLFLEHYILFIFNYNYFKYWWGFIVFSITWIFGLYLQVYIQDKLYENTKKETFF